MFVTKKKYQQAIDALNDISKKYKELKLDLKALKVKIEMLEKKNRER